MRKRETVILWGLVFMTSYLYAYQITTAIRFVPTPKALPEHGVEARQITEGLYWATTWVFKVLWSFSFPTVVFSRRFLPEDYYSELIYIPFINAFQWFVYGALFGWWRHSRKTSISGKR
jgi:hypothetical protein